MQEGGTNAALTLSCFLLWKLIRLLSHWQNLIRNFPIFDFIEPAPQQQNVDSRERHKACSLFQARDENDTVSVVYRNDVPRQRHCQHQRRGPIRRYL